MGRHYLESLFAPQAIAVFGAFGQPDSAGARVYRNLREGGFKGPIHAIDPARDGQPRHSSIEAATATEAVTATETVTVTETVALIKAVAAIKAVKERVDLAVIATPAATVPGILHACGAHGVKAAIVIATDGDGRNEMNRAWGRTVLDAAERAGLRLLGPGNLGFMRPAAGINATPGHITARPGSLALVSQSGSLCAAVLDWADTQRIGFSAVVSLGAGSDVDFGDILDYLALDPETRSILMYVESIRDARRFIGGLRAAARLKPVIAIKAGQHAEETRAALSHMGTLLDTDAVFDAALRRAGVVRARSIGQLFAAAQLLSTRHRLRGNRLVIVTNAGGPGIMAADRALKQGLQLAPLSTVTLDKLARLLPAGEPCHNPVNLLGDATPEHYGAAVETCLHDNNVDGALVLLTPQAATQPTEAAEAVIQAAAPISKPVLACWLGAAQVQAGRELFARHQVPSFGNPESALEAFGFLAEHHANRTLLMQAPGPLSTHIPPDLTGARLIIEGALAERRTRLSALETRALLRAFHIPTAPVLTVHSPNEALAAAGYLGFPVVLKILAPDLVHKSDVDGVRLNIDSAETVRHAYNELLATVRARRPELRIDGVTVEQMYRDRHGRELLVGVIDDPVFGPVIGFGAGGTAADILRDHAVALPPLNEHLADTLIHQTRVARLLDSFRNFPPVDRAAVVGVLLRLSELACELPEIKELEINPLVADDRGVLALDARIVVHEHAPGRRRYGHMAIHPYPLHLARRVQLSDGTDIAIRPIRPEDAEIEQAFVRKLSPEAKFFRFMNSLQELSQDLLIRLTQLDYDRELALIATLEDNGTETQLGVARYFGNPDSRTAEFALVVADDWQQRGLGTRLMCGLIEAAREKGFRALQGEILANNVKMLALVKKLEFACRVSADDPGLMVAVKSL